LELCSISHRDFFHQTKALVQQRSDAQIDQLVVDVVPLTARGEDPKVRESLELVRDGLGFHPEGFGQVAHAQFLGPDQCVE
jgi:hypothetical protein